MINRNKSIEINSIPLNLLIESIPPRNLVMPLNCYHTLRISLVTNGRGIWTIGDRNFPIEKGDIFTLNNNEHRKIHTIFPPANLELVILEFEPRMIWSNYGDYFDHRFLDVFFERDTDFENRIESGNRTATEISDLILQIQKEMNDSLPEYQQVVKANLLKSLALLNRHYYGKGIKDPTSLKSSNKQPAEIGKVMKYIEDHLSEDITLPELAGIVHINPSYFSRLFSLYNGLSVTKYINKMRIKKSISLLSDKNKTILEIAFLCGFNNLSNFYLAFKSVTNSTPTAFRAIM